MLRVKCGSRVSILLCIGIVLGCLNACSQAGEYHSLQGPSMGTIWNLTYRQTGAENAPAAVHARVTQLLTQLNAEFSTYSEDSQVAAFNRAPADEWVAVAPDVITVAKQAIQLSQQTHGAFDMSITPVLRLWGFGPGGKPGHIPMAAQLAKAMRLVDYLAIDVREQPPALRKRKAGMQVNFNALVAGYAADRVAAILNTMGVNDFLVDMGGELRLAGVNPQGDLWQVAVEKPLDAARTVERVLQLSDTGLSTSGDYRNFFIHNGQRYSHEFDARSGWPVKQNVASVTVVAPSAMLADGYATALLALGLGEALKLAQAQGLAALFILRDGKGGWRELPTAAFRALEQTP